MGQSESTLKCPMCKSTSIISRGSTTDQLYEPFIDIFGKIHYHDENVTKLMYECLKCDEKWPAEIIPHKCSCGWVQNAGRLHGVTK